MNCADISTVKNWVIAHTTETPVEESGFFYKESYFSPEQIKHHNRVDDAWVVDCKQGVVYNVTPIFDASIIPHHGLANKGMREQLTQRLGGAKDVSLDIEMHRGVRAQALWQAMRIGKVVNE